MSAPDLRQRTRGILFILSGPSGVGKDTILRQAMSQLTGLRTSISVTTRSPRPGEINGEDYIFVTADEFALMMERGDLLEHAAVHGNFYGTPKSWVMEQLQAGTDVVLEIDVQGAIQIKSLFPHAILVFLAPPSWEELAHRLRGRNTEDEVTIQRRLRNARQEIARVDQYEYLIINDRMADAIDRLRAVVLAERSRPWRQNIARLLEGDQSGE
ncbi:MAG TPA: guanylate kinase [Armatimonadota bacterium]|nr:guanylate kinase [Armatimonadota bacterium]